MELRASALQHFSPRCEREDVTDSTWTGGASNWYTHSSLFPAMNFIRSGRWKTPVSKCEKLVSPMVQVRGLASWQRQPPIDPTTSALKINSIDWVQNWALSVEHARPIKSIKRIQQHSVYVSIGTIHVCLRDVYPRTYTEILVSNTPEPWKKMTTLPYFLLNVPCLYNQRENHKPLIP